MGLYAGNMINMYRIYKTRTMVINSQVVCSIIQITVIENVNTILLLLMIL